MGGKVVFAIIFVLVFLLVSSGIVSAGFFGDLFGKLFGKEIDSEEFNYQPSVCDDGIDNDNDGLVDWQVDLGCWGAEDDNEQADTRENENGWTTFDKSSDTVILYVAASGSDTLNNCQNKNNPCKTIQYSVSKLDDLDSGNTGKANWLLLKRGDSFGSADTEALTTINIGKDTGGISGRSESERTLIGTYGDSAESPVLHNMILDLYDTDYFAIIGLDIFRSVNFLDNNDPGDGENGVFAETNKGNNHLLFEGNVVRYYEDKNIRRMPDNSEFRRNIVLNSVRSGFSTSEMDNTLVEENIFDYTGRINTDLQPYGHGVYSSEVNGAIVRNNIFSRSQFTNLRFRSDITGGSVNNLIENNLFIAGRQQIDIDDDTGNTENTHEDFIIRGNVFTEPGYVNHGSGGIKVQSSKDFLIEDNYFVHLDPDNKDHAYSAIHFKSPVNSFITIKNNHIYGGWGDIETRSEDEDVTLENNYVNLDENNYVDASRTLVSYYKDVENVFGAINTEDFIEKIRAQRRYNWDNAYTALEVVPYFKSGFTLANDTEQVCGNGIVEGEEICDSNSQSCTDTNGNAGTRICNSQCTGYNICVANPDAGEELSLSFSTNTPVSEVNQLEIPVGLISEGDSHYSFVDFNSDLLLWLPMDETTVDGDPKDSSSYNRDFDIVGNASQFASGKFGKSFQFDGSGDYLIEELNSAYLNNVEEFSLSLWIKSDVVNSDKGFIYGIEPDMSDGVFSLRYDSEGFRSGCVNCIKAGITTSQGRHQVESSSNKQTTEWQHLVLVWKNGENLKLYINGALDSGAFVVDSLNNGGVLSGITQLRIGRGAQDNLATEGWDGLIDDVLIFSRALSTGEIGSLFDANVNQYSRTFSNLADGETYSIKGHAVDLSGNMESVSRSVSVDMSVTQQDCVLESAKWSTDEAVNGDRIALSVIGDNCAGETASFEIFEDDIVGEDELIETELNDAVFIGFSSGIARASTGWTVIDVGDGFGLPEYYFIATLESAESSSIQSSLMQLITESQEVECGNGILEAEEECDDGSSVDGDGCSSMCMDEFCGDGVVQSGLGEECDEGNEGNIDDGIGCSTSCLMEDGGDGEEVNCENSCNLNGKCVVYGFRTEDEYCDVITDEFISQKNDNEECNNDFECLSNSCIDRVCTEQGLLAKIIEFFRTLCNLFGRLCPID